MDYNDLAHDRQEEVDRLADQFEREFKAGRDPRIEDYLERHPDLRAQLLAELIVLEIELRQAEDDPLVAEQYFRRFPNDREIVQFVWAGKTGAMEPPPKPQKNHAVDAPEQLGRYKIQKLLGRGGYGEVYLAHDPQLGRPVALKVLRRKWFRSTDHVARFLEEARTAANLKHPLLVAVYDVQQQDDVPYIVQEYIDGQNLKKWAAHHTPTFQQIARVLIQVAEGLGYVHQQGLTHCDVKLANVLMDAADQPHIADFGLAIHESTQALRVGEAFGTPETMAPEQVRGESHHLDGRTDIWAIGVMLYELLVGRLPFTAPRGEGLFAEIQSHDPKPPRLIDRAVPRALERICLQCLSKRRSERYNTTDDLREDLLAWLGEAPPHEAPPGEAPPGETSRTPAPSAADSSSDVRPQVKIMSRGLRSFEPEDAAFFLELLPGPRDREGLTESIRFWKNRVEEVDPDRTFSVGLIYGPSGCGKSSLVKAGLLPRLSDHVLSLYVSATADDTEVSLLKHLRKQIPRLPANISLPEAFAEVRLRGAGRHQKVLLVIDQFEQWLHSHPESKNRQLVDALRQCEGGRLQTILLVRDDFYLSVNRVFHELEIRLVEGHNYRVVDLFDLAHARKVLTAFGRAIGKLDDSLSEEQERFLTQSVCGLSEANRVVSLRLALFAEMMKGEQWTHSNLQAIGDARHVCVAFLKNAFSGATASPARRAQEGAVRRVLAMLLPDPGTEIKGRQRSRDELQAESQLAPHDFRDLLRVLDQEMRLLTPVDSLLDSLQAREPNPRDSMSAPDGHASKAASCSYQLTHDFLVEPIREWLREGKGGWRWRAKIRLEELTNLWRTRRESRYLPSFSEFVPIFFGVPFRQHNVDQRSFVLAASRRHGLRTALAVGILAALVFLGAWASRTRRMSLEERVLRVGAQIDRMLDASPSDFWDYIKQLEDDRDLLLRQLDRLQGKGTPHQQWRVTLALVYYGRATVATVLDQFNAADAGECKLVLSILRRVAPDKALAEKLAQEPRSGLDSRDRMRLAVLCLALGEPHPLQDYLQFSQHEQRLLFIEEFGSWNSGLKDVVRLLDDDTVDPAVVTAVLNSISVNQSVFQNEKGDLSERVQAIHQNHPDGALHSASGTWLQTYAIPVPKLACDDAANPPDRRWLHIQVPNALPGQTPVSLTLIKVEPGEFEIGQEKVVVGHAFYMSDTEISNRLYKQYVDDVRADRYKPEGG